MEGCKEASDGGHGDVGWLCSRRGGGGDGGAAVVVVLALVGDDQHRGVVGRSLHVLPRRASPHAAALVVAPAVEKEESD